jgi:hypothetical protein
MRDSLLVTKRGARELATVASVSGRAGGRAGGIAVAYKRYQALFYEQRLSKGRTTGFFKLN